VTNAARAVAASYVYESFGATTMQTQIVVSPYGFTGREADNGDLAVPGPGLYYYRARYYDPAIGRFLSEDPLRFDVGINFYRYVKNNPVTLADPYGLKVQKCCRYTQVNAWVDFLSRLTGVKHCFIKTDTITAGMGPANGGPLPACPIGIQTQITDHSAEAISPGDCKDVQAVDEECVNQALKIGTPTGRWTPTNVIASWTTCSPNAAPARSGHLAKADGEHPVEADGSASRNRATYCYEA
jgi:RHS repeat-associated protein